MPRVIKENLSWLLPLLVSLSGGGIALYVKAETGPRMAAVETKQNAVDQRLDRIERGIDRLIDMHLQQPEPKR